MNVIRNIRNLLSPRVVYVPSRRQRAVTEYDRRKAEKTEQLRREVANRLAYEAVAKALGV